MNEAAMTLPAKYYIDPAYFREEMESFFMSAWVCAGREQDIPKAGDYFLRELGPESLIIARGNDGRVRALYNVCRHRGTRLCEETKGTFKGSIQCPYHAWTYGLDGKLNGAPHMGDVAGFSLEKYPLHQAACETWAGNIFVNLSKAPRPLSEQLGNLIAKFAPWRMEELVLARRKQYTIKANWKLIIQNYSECLHCPVIHPALQKISHYMSGDNEPPHPHYLGGSMLMKEGVTTMTMSGKSSRAPFPGLDEQHKRHVYYYAILPNLLLSAHPDYVMTHTLWPKSERETDVTCEFHFHPDEMKKPGFSPDDALEFWDITNEQDWKVSEISQLGLNSRAYTPGPYSQREALLHGLDQIVLEREAASRARNGAATTCDRARERAPGAMV